MEYRRIDQNWMFRYFQPIIFYIVCGHLCYVFHYSYVGITIIDIKNTCKERRKTNNIFIQHKQTSTVKYEFHSCEIFLYSLIKYSFIYLIPVVHSLFRKFLSWYLLNESFSIKSNWWFFFILIPSCHTSSRFTIFCTNTYWT